MRNAILLCCLALAPAGAQQRWTGKVDVTIGGANETRDAYMLNVVSGLELDRSGRIIVSDPVQNQVSVFSATGKHLYSFGQKGQGPGDMNMPCCIATDDRGRLWVREMSNRRHSVFALADSGARHLYSVAVRGGSMMERLHFDAAGAVMFQVTESFSSAPMRTVRQHGDSSGTIVRRDTLNDPPPADSTTRVSVVRTSNGGRSVSWTNIMFTPQFLRAEAPGGELAEVPTSAKYEITWYDAAYKPLRKLTGQADAPPVSAAERQKARDEIATFAKRMQAEVDVESAKIPARKPPIASIGFDIDGRLWVERSVAEGRPHEADVYDRQGRLVARASWPAGVTIRYHAIRGMTGLGILTDDDDVPSIVRITFSR